MRYSSGRVIILLLVAVFSGCGGNQYQTATVRGKVTTCDGKPAAGGVVIFTPVDDPQQTGRPAGQPGRESRGTVSEDGTFTLTTIGLDPTEGAVVGPHRVTFEMPPTERPVLREEEKADMSPEEIKKWEEEFAKRPVYPAIRCSANITPGEVKVAAGENTLEFTLPSK